MLSGVTPQMFARLASPGGQVIQTNHAAWVFGHLALYWAREAGQIGRDGGPLAAPSNFGELFKGGAECRDDPTEANYPAMEVATQAFFKGIDGLLQMLESVDDATFQSPVAEEKVRVQFPTIGARINFMCTSHIMMHLGQVSAWDGAWGWERRNAPDPATRGVLRGNV